MLMQMRRIAVFGNVLLVVLVTSCRSPEAPTPVDFSVSTPAPCVPVPGTSCLGQNGWVEYVVGELPIVISVPHGGAITPTGIPDRTFGPTVTDRNTIDLVRAISDALLGATGRRPHVVISHLRRTKLDPNREVMEAAQGNPAMTQAWTEYHDFIEQARSQAAGAFFIDLHGHGHAIDRVEWGYLLSVATLDQSDAMLDAGGVGNLSSLRALLSLTPDSFSAVLRGPMSLGGLLPPAFPSVPSPGAPSPGGAEYFSGGYTTRRHTTTAAGVQLEASFPGLRDTAANRAAFGGALAVALRAFAERHLGVVF